MANTTTVNTFFNSELYLSQNPDLVRAGLRTPEQLWAHYSTYGAQESTTATERAPNSWFDVNYYLSNNPDLGENGVNASNALDHYQAYGIYEGRTFNPSAALDPSNFNAQSYAEENDDVREALGIENAEELTEEQQAQLLSHYFSYGYKEDRPGVSEDFADSVLANNTIDVDAYFADNADATTVVGTIGDDQFTVNGNVQNKTIDGSGGNNTVTIGENAETAGAEATEADEEQETEAADAAEPLVLRNISQVVTKSTQDTEFKSNQVVDLEVAAGNGVVNAMFDKSAVVGTDDEFNVTTQVDASDITVTGIETLNLTAVAEVATATVNANKVNGDSLTVNLTSAREEATAVTVESANSPALRTITIDGSDMKGALDLTLGDQAQNVKNLEVIGGAGDDTFNATAAIDTFTGGEGENTFAFTAETTAIRVADGKIDAVDTITDFKGEDSVTGIANLEVVTETGLLPGGASLEDLATGTTGLESGNVFGYGDDTYILVTQADELADVELVKLAGVNVDQVEVSGSDLVYS